MRTARRGTKAGIAALMSFTLIAAACGGNDNGGAGEGGTATAPPVASTAPGDTGGDTSATIADATTDTAGDTGSDTSTPAGGDAGSGDSTAPAVSDEGEPQQGGTLRYGLEADVDGINPTSSALSAPGLTMGNAVFDTLTARTVDGDFVPYLAESVEPNDDFTQWTVKLRPDILFHDGTPLNAEAIVKNFEIVRNDPLVGIAVKPFYPEEGAIEIVDDLTVQFNLLEGSRYLVPGALSGQLGMVASPAWIDAALADPTLNQQPVGTGPFKFDSRSEDSITTFVRNDDWWGGDVYLDKIEFVPVTDPASRNDLFFGGDLNALQGSDPESVEALLNEPGVQSVFDETGEETFNMVNSAVPPFDDIRARQALAFATPLENYRQLIGLGTASPADQMFTEENPFYNPDVVQQGDDIEAARPLVEAYCAEKGSDVNTVLNGPTCTDGKINMEYQFSGPSVINSRAADIFNEGWSALFNVTFQEVAQDDGIQQAALGQYNVVYWRQFGGEDPSLDNVWLLCRTVGGISLNWPKFCDPDRDALLLEASLAENGPEREAMYQQLSQRLNDDFLYTFLVHTPWDNAFSEDVRGACSRLSPEGDPLICSTNGRNWFSSIWLA